MKLSAVMDFTDECVCSENGYTPEAFEALAVRLSENNVSRLYVQYYGNKETGWVLHCDAPEWEKARKTTERMPEWSRVLVEALHRHHIEAVGVMRPQENGVFVSYSPIFTEGVKTGVPRIGGQILSASAFMREHPELRIKRRSWDIDPEGEKKVIGSIRLYKQNAVPSRIRKEDITLYVSDDNSNYRKYEEDFTLTVSKENAKETVLLSKTVPDYAEEILTAQGAPIEVLTLSGLHVKERFAAVSVRCTGPCPDGETRFYNSPVNGIACFTEDGTPICATPGGTCRPAPCGRTDYLTAGFNFDDGFGAYQAITLDPDDGEGFLAIAKGKNLYVHAALCECEPAVREYWLSLLEMALEDGYDLIGNRIECHSVHVDEPFAYGYNDCIKEEYFKRYGVCTEREMDLSKIAKIRGDAYSELFAQAARRVHAHGKKVVLTLNIEMLHDPIPLDRRYAYPMNVEWQWERWLEETEPDEINFRMYYNSPDYLLSDPQCLRMLETARSYGVPLTVERYTYFDFVAEFKKLRDMGTFSRMSLYETANLFRGKADGTVEMTQRGKELLPPLAGLSD